MHAICFVLGSRTRAEIQRHPIRSQGEPQRVICLRTMTTRFSSGASGNVSLHDVKAMGSVHSVFSDQQFRWASGYPLAASSCVMTSATFGVPQQRMAYCSGELLTRFRRNVPSRPGQRPSSRNTLGLWSFRRAITAFEFTILDFISARQRRLRKFSGEDMLSPDIDYTSRIILTAAMMNNTG